MFSLSRTKFRWSRTLWAAVLLIPVLSYAQIAIDLPGVVGVYAEDLVVGQFMHPATVGSGAARLIVEGSIVPGSVEYMGSPGRVPKGSEVHIFIFIGGVGGLLVAYASAEIPPIEGSIFIEADLLAPNGAPFHLLTGSGTLDYQLFIGFHPEWVPVGEIKPIPAVVTINSARIVSDIGVWSDESSWGSVKGLYR